MAGMGWAFDAWRAPAAVRPVIDVLAFPPSQTELQRWQRREAAPWLELERLARIAFFLGAGMFLAWAADVGAAFEFGKTDGSALFGAASVPLALVVVLAHLSGRWALARARRGHSDVRRRYSDVTLREAKPLIAAAQNDAVVAQYLRCVGRQGRPLRRLERSALLAWSRANAL